MKIKTEKREASKEISTDLSAFPCFKNLNAGITIRWFEELGAHKRTDGKIVANKKETVEQIINSKELFKGKRFVM